MNIPVSYDGIYRYLSRIGSVTVREEELGSSTCAYLGRRWWILRSRFKVEVCSTVSMVLDSYRS